jgi:colicin import membrane protein
MPVRRMDTDRVIINTAKTIGSAIGAGSAAMTIGRDSARQARTMDTSGLKSAAMQKKEMAVEQLGKQADMTKKKAAQKADMTKKVASAKAEEAKKAAAVKAGKTRKMAEDRVDELREAAADKIAPKRKRGLLARIRA